MTSARSLHAKEDESHERDNTRFTARHRQRTWCRTAVDGPPESDAARRDRGTPGTAATRQTRPRRRAVPAPAGLDLPVQRRSEPLWTRLRAARLPVRRRPAAPGDADLE